MYIVISYFHHNVHFMKRTSSVIWRLDMKVPYSYCCNTAWLCCLFLLSLGATHSQKRIQIKPKANMPVRHSWVCLQNSIANLSHLNARISLCWKVCQTTDYWVQTKYCCMSLNMSTYSDASCYEYFNSTQQRASSVLKPIPHHEETLQSWIFQLKTSKLKLIALVLV